MFAWVQAHLPAISKQAGLSAIKQRGKADELNTMLPSEHHLLMTMCLYVRHFAIQADIACKGANAHPVWVGHQL